MIRVGFVGAVSKEWMGGLNYFKNLLFALDSLEEKKLEIFVFVGTKTDQEIKNMFNSYAQVIEDSMFDRKSLKWYLTKIEQKFLRTNFLLSNFFKKYDVQVLSHASAADIKEIKIINWIPDFQHLHLPNMFSKKEIDSRNQSFMNIIKKSDLVVLSSYDALKDFRSFAPQYENKARVLQFVSQPDKRYFELNENDKVALLNKYNIQDEFFYMPNQFWKHKNHILVFEAIKQLVQEGSNICLICTGHLQDYRNLDYIEIIKEFIESNNLENNIKLLGLVEYEAVFGLIKFSQAVINPSLFEGWSSTVEECKSVKKNMILSDLDVHKEQYLEATFFKRNSVKSFKNVLKSYENKETNQKIDDLHERTQSFAKVYVDIVEEVVE